MEKAYYFPRWETYLFIYVILWKRSFLYIFTNHSGKFSLVTLTIELGKVYSWVELYVKKSYAIKSLRHSNRSQLFSEIFFLSLLVRHERESFKLLRAYFTVQCY